MHNNRATFTNRLPSQGLSTGALISFQALLVGVPPAVQHIYHGKMRCMRLNLAIMDAVWVVVLPSLCDEFSIIPAPGAV